MKMHRPTHDCMANLHGLTVTAIGRPTQRNSYEGTAVYEFACSCCGDLFRHFLTFNHHTWDRRRDQRAFDFARHELTRKQRGFS